MTLPTESKAYSYWFIDLPVGSYLCKEVGSIRSPFEAVKSIANDILIAHPLLKYSMKLGISWIIKLSNIKVPLL